ncbi:MAG: M3 family metallopeptidase [Actinomycetota bacterium]|nr:M3 family metallopeptidase [Actinomycetota bacterium]
MVKQQALKLEKMHSYDLYVPLVKDSQSDYPYQQATDIIKECLETMGPDYLKIIDLAMGNRWIDVVEARGRPAGPTPGAAMTVTPLSCSIIRTIWTACLLLPMSWAMRYTASSSNKNQPYINSSYSIFLAEIASTLNEIMLTEYLLKNSPGREKKIYVLNHYLEQFRNTVFRQTMFAEFEKTIHHMAQNQQPLTQKNLSDIYFELNKNIMGPGCRWMKA